MYALFRAGQAELLEWQPGWAQLPLLPLVWSLSRARLVEGTDLASRLARIWLRWNPNHRACSRHTTDACLRGLLDAPSWEARLTWLLLLLEGYGDRAADPLLPWLRHHDEEMRQIAALGLGQLGRQIIPDLKDRWTCALPAERDAICQTLWYLGPQAHGCLQWLGEHDRPWPRALYYAMEQHGWPALLALGDLPVWLDEASLERVARLVFSTRALDRERAIIPLTGWGPARSKAVALLRILAQDPQPDIASESLRKLFQVSEQPGMATLQLGLLSRDEPTQLEALKALARSQSGWALSNQFSPLDMHAHLTRQKALVRSRVLWPSPWPEQVLDYLTKEGVPDSGLAHEMLQGEITQAGVQAYLRLDGALQPLVALCQEGPDSSARLIFGELLSQQRWPEVLECVGRPELLEMLHGGYVLLQLLNSKKFGQLTQYEKRLRAQLESPDAEVADWSRRLLAQLDLSQVHWDLWPTLKPNQIDTLLLMIEFRNQFPIELVTPIREGRFSQRELLATLVRTHPQAESILLDCLEHCRVADRDHIRQSLRNFGLSSWLSLMEVLAEGGEAVEFLHREFASITGGQRVEHLLQRGPDFLPEHLPRALARGLAEALLYSGAPPDHRRFPWAVRLSQDANAGHCPIYHLYRSGEAGLKAATELFRHQDPRVRYGAIVCARFAYPDWVWLFRSQPPDPDPENRLRVLEHLHCKVGLTENEWAQLEELSQITATSYGARVLLEGRGGEPRNGPDA